METTVISVVFNGMNWKNLYYAEGIKKEIEIKSGDEIRYDKESMDIVYVNDVQYVFDFTKVISITGREKLLDEKYTIVKMPDPKEEGIFIFVVVNTATNIGFVLWDKTKTNDPDVFIFNPRIINVENYQKYEELGDFTNSIWGSLIFEFPIAVAELSK